MQKRADAGLKRRVIGGRWHILVGFAPGGPTDILARLIGQWLSERLGQQLVIENRPGAATNIATEAVIRSAPDGYTLLAANQLNKEINVGLADPKIAARIADLASNAFVALPADRPQGRRHRLLPR